MRSLPLILTAAAAIAALTMAVSAAPPAPQDQPGRFTMQPTDGGFLRLDTATGDVSLCAKTAGSFECKPVRDDRDLQAEIGRLAAENKALKQEIKHLEDMLGLNGGPERKKGFELPSEQDVDKALSYLERMFKKFRDKLKEFDAPAPGNEAPGGGSGKGTPL